MVQNCFTIFNADRTSDNKIELSIRIITSRSGFPGSIPSFNLLKYARMMNGGLAKLLNALFVEGQFLLILEVSLVIPIFIAGLRELIKNYRPISNLANLLKVYVKFMCKR